MVSSISICTAETFDEFDECRGFNVAPLGGII